eukprot:TRINITY_DN26381_c0_g2_i1.p1 TRINITY_DN26381_c0_g2~~TRINITY_DN26381_c0_g2_i1.p1  ORF type:complete len:280 (+),score=44.24 TRINITY_DN26381_c0_g2_i1:116-841(+)
MSTLMGNSKRYTTLEYVAASLLCVGTAGFTYRSGKLGTAQEDVILGICMLIVSALCDATASNTQQRLMQQNGYPPMVVMVRLNLVGALGTVGVLIISGHAGSLAKQTWEDPRIWQFCSLVSMSLAVAVWAYTQLLNESGSVFAVGVATVRKVLTLILSFVVFPKPFSSLHVISFFLVVMGIFLSTTKKGKTAKAEKTKPSDVEKNVKVEEIANLVGKESNSEEEVRWEGLAKESAAKFLPV